MKNPGMKILRVLWWRLWQGEVCAWSRFEIALNGLKEWSDLRTSVNRVISKRTVSATMKKLFRSLCAQCERQRNRSAISSRKAKWTTLHTNYDHNNCEIFVRGSKCLNEHILAIYVVCLVITLPLFMDCLFYLLNILVRFSL